MRRSPWRRLATEPQFWAAGGRWGADSKGFGSRACGRCPRSYQCSLITLWLDVLEDKERSWIARDSGFVDRGDCNLHRRVFSRLQGARPVRICVAVVIPCHRIGLLARPGRLLTH
jgi:hypothetical protein